jgi:hypothetical protein
VQRFERRKHAFNVMISEVQTRCLFKTLVPLFVPQNRNTDELVANKARLFDQIGTVLAHCFHDTSSRARTCTQIRFHRYCERVDESLRMCPANIDKQVVNGFTYQPVWLVDTSNQLRHDFEPGIDAHRRDTLLHVMCDFLV